MNESDAINPTTYIELLAEYERYLCGYVYNMIPNATDAEDVLQEVKVALWKAFDQYQEGTNFGAWSRKVAFHRVMAFRKKKAIENKRLTFSDECLDYLAEQFPSDAQQVSEQSALLSVCITKLKGEHKELIQMRYARELSIEETAAQSDKTIDACYRALSRIRTLLRKCVQQSISKQA
jgi:RNA polymerase sigma-70 factor (ECF subfamily)